MRHKDRELEELENLQQDPNFWDEMNAPPSDEEVVLAKDLTRRYLFISKRLIFNDTQDLGRLTRKVSRHLVQRIAITSQQSDQLSKQRLRMCHRLRRSFPTAITRELLH